MSRNFIDGSPVETTLVNTKSIEIPRLLWMGLVFDLRRVGEGRRESGAFLMGRIGAERQAVTSYIRYDELDDGALANGIVEFHRPGFSRLWDICKVRGLEVLADVHTHPGRDVRQSPIDSANPMVPLRGHIALILPKFAKTSPWSLGNVGIHQFVGLGQWRSFQAAELECPVRLCLW